METYKVKAADVAKLRKMTGAGMMDSKKALQEAGGDFDKATGILRKKGQKLAAKRADRDNAEGVVVAKRNADDTLGIMLSLNCETDFVAKNEDFIQLAHSLLALALERDTPNLETLLDETMGDLGVREKLTEQTAVIGEKIEINHFSRLEAPYVGCYIHANNKIGALVGLSKGGSAAAEVAKNVAMQVAAMSPIALDREGVSQRALEHELEIGKELAIKEGKPAELAEKIARGRLGKFFRENTLVSQDYIKDNKLSVEKYVQSVDRDLSITAFEKINLG